MFRLEETCAQPERRLEHTLPEFLAWTKLRDVTQRILVIEDDPSVRTLLERGLAYEGYLVEAAEDGETGLEIARDRPADLIVLDVMLPGIDGLEVLRRLRSVDDDLPVILLTARDRPEHQVEGLEAGADDYVTKPFSFDVLLARVRTQLRRRDKMPEVLRFEDITLDAATHTVKRGERDITFTGQEFRLMQAFMEQPERVQSKSVLLDRAWGVDYLGDPNIVETYIKLLRQKLEAEGESRVIHTIRGVGYVLRSG